MSEVVVPIAAAVVVHAGRVLVQTRAPGRSWDGHWEFPGGKLESGEDPAAAAVRECREELGLEVVVLERLAGVDWSYPGARVHVDFLLCALVGPPDALAPAEGQQARWADADELSRLRFLPANAGVLAVLAERLRAAGGGGGGGGDGRPPATSSAG